MNFERAAIEKMRRRKKAEEEASRTLQEMYIGILKAAVAEGLLPHPDTLEGWQRAILLEELTREMSLDFSSIRYAWDRTQKRFQQMKPEAQLVTGREEHIVNGTPAQVVGFAQNFVPADHIRVGKYGPQDHPIKFQLGDPFHPLNWFLDEGCPSKTIEVTALYLPGDSPKTLLVIAPDSIGGDWEKVRPIWEGVLQQLRRMGFLPSPTPPGEVVPDSPVSGGETTEGSGLSNPNKQSHTQTPNLNQQIATTATHYGVTVKKISPQESAAKPMGTTDKTYRKYLKKGWLLSEDEFQKVKKLSIADYWERKWGEG